MLLVSKANDPLRGLSSAMERNLVSPYESGGEMGCGRGRNIQGSFPNTNDLNSCRELR